MCPLIHMNKTTGILLLVIVVVSVLAGTSIKTERDFTGVPIGSEVFDCSIYFVDPEDGCKAIRIGIYNASNNDMDRCSTLKERCLIQQGLKAPSVGSYSLMTYSFNCEWDDKKKSCTCSYP